jgi:excisionase family DNA binding protein
MTRLLVDADALAALLHAAAGHRDPNLRAAAVDLVRTGTAPAPTPRPWLPLPEAAALLDVSERTVRREVERGRLAHRRVGRRLLIAAEAITGPGRTTADTAGAGGATRGDDDPTTDTDPSR